MKYKLIYLMCFLAFCSNCISYSRNKFPKEGVLKCISNKEEIRNFLIWQNIEHDSAFTIDTTLAKKINEEVNVDLHNQDTSLIEVKWLNAYYKEYNKEYGGYFYNENKMVVIQFVNILISNKNEFSEIFDGGCGVIILLYDLKKQKIMSIVCNGTA